MARNVTSKFGVADGLDFSSEQGITSIAIDKLVPYRNHRFTLYKGERLEDMIQSIKKNGIITPIIVRTMDNGKYEILSGHNRVYAAGQAGLTSVPAVVKTDLPDEFAEIYVVESNAMQRGFKELRISEQALAVEMIYKRLKNSEAVRAIEKELSVLEGVKSPMDTCNDSNKNEVKSPMDTCEKVDNLKGAAEEGGLSRASIARLLRINKLSDEMKAMVDEGNIKLRPAVELSYIPKKCRICL